jgi:hypothetical protein
MRKIILVTILSLTLVSANAQLQVLKLVGKNSKEFTLGYGAFLKFGFPVSDADAVTFEGGINFFFDKESSDYGIAVVPVKVGYRYTLNRSGKGFYAEPQAGYNVYGVNSFFDTTTFQDVNKKFHGFVWSVGGGYLFEPGKWIQLDIGLRYESIIVSGGSTNYLALRFSHNFGLNKRTE